MKKPKRMSKAWWRKSNHRELAMKTAVKNGRTASRRRYNGGAAACRRTAMIWEWWVATCCDISGSSGYDKLSSAWPLPAARLAAVLPLLLRKRDGKAAADSAIEAAAL